MTSEENVLDEIKIEDKSKTTRKRSKKATEVNEKSEVNAKLKSKKSILEIKDSSDIVICNETIDEKINKDITPDLVARELYSVYLKCSQEIPVTVKDKETGKYVPTGVYQFDARCALKALELLGDAVGLFKVKDETEENKKALTYEEILKSEEFKYEF